MDILELNHLTEAERDLILSVVQRDEDLQKKELARIEKLKAEIKLLKMKGALKPGMNAEKSCARCRKPFGWLFDKGEVCIKCEQKVCEECRVQQKESNKWFCVLCQKQKELDAMSGAWFYEKFRKSKRSKKTNKCITGTDLVRSSFKKRSHAEMSESSVYGVKQSLSSRKHGSSPEADEESSDTQSMEAQSPRYVKKPDFNDAAFPKDAEKIMLLDLIGGPTVATVHQGDNNVSLEPAVQVQRIHTHRFSDSSSEGASVPSSPQFSHRTESEYPASESINSSFRSTSAMSSDGQYTMVTDNNSVISGISTAPPSMHQSPKLNSQGRTSYTDRMPAQEYSVSDIAVAKRLAADQTSKDSIHAINPDSSPIHRQTVKVSSRGRTVSSSSSEGDELLASSLQQGKLREVMAVGVVVHATYSSGSESSRTVQAKHGQHSDVLSQHSGSVSCADTGSTLDAPVLEPPTEFLSLEDTVDSNPEQSELNVTGVEQLASVRQKVNSLLAKYNAGSTADRAGYSVDSSRDQNVHRSQDDYDVIDTPPFQKKARFVDSTTYKFASDDDPDISQSSIEDQALGNPNGNTEEMDWDNEDFDEVTNQNLLASIHQSTASNEQKNTKSGFSLPAENKSFPQSQDVGGQDRGGYIRPNLTDYVILPGYDSDDYSDSLSVITERTEPDEEDTEQESDSDRTMSPAASLKALDSDIDLDEMFECNKSILEMHESEQLFMPISSKAKDLSKGTALLQNRKSSNVSSEPQKVKGSQSKLLRSNVHKKDDNNVALKTALAKYQTATKPSRDKSNVSTLHEEHKVKCEKYECITTSPAAAKSNQVTVNKLGTSQKVGDARYTKTVSSDLHANGVEMIDESHLKSVLHLQNLFNSKSAVRKPRVSKEYADSDKETENSIHTYDLVDSDTSQEFQTNISTNWNQNTQMEHELHLNSEQIGIGKEKHSDVPCKKYHKDMTETSKCDISPLASSVVDSALWDAYDTIKKQGERATSVQKDQLQNTEVGPKSSSTGVVLEPGYRGRNNESIVSTPACDTHLPVSSVSLNQGEHFAKEKSFNQTSSPVIKRKNKKSHLKSHGIIHPAFASQSVLKQLNNSPHSNESESHGASSHSDFLCSTPTQTSALSRKSSANLSSPGASSLGSLGLSKASSPEVDQTLPSDLSSVQDVDHSSDLSSRRVTHSSYTGSVPSISVTDKSLAELEAKEEDDNIDDLVDSFKNKPQARSHSNLMSPFSSSVESVASIYSEAGEGNFGKIPVTGEIQFGLDYNYKTNLLEIHIKQCKDIAAVDAKKKRSDPYVKTYLLPDRTKSGKKKTRVRKHTVNPVFNEIIKYHISKSEVETRTLWVTIWHNDTFGRNDFLGEVTLPLDYYEFKDRTPKWYTLQERAPVQTSLLTYKGDFNVALKYITADNVSGRKVKGKSGNKGELLVLVKQARNLTAVRSNGTSDPFCKGYLLPEKGKGGKQKSPVIKKDCNPQWNHTFVFEDVGWEELRERTLEITIWDHDRFTSNDFLGGVRLGLGTGRSFSHDVEWSDSRGEEISVWQSMLDRPNTWIEVTLLLRPNMNSRTPSL